MNIVPFILGSYHGVSRLQSDLYAVLCEVRENQYDPEQHDNAVPYDYITAVTMVVVNGGYYSKKPTHTLNDACLLGHLCPPGKTEVLSEGLF